VDNKEEPTEMAVTDDDIRQCVYDSCWYLDREEFENYLGTFAPDMRYFISTYSEELRKDMIWLDHDRVGMENVFAMLPQHVRMEGNFMRQANVYRITRDKKNGHADVTTTFIVVYTDLDGVTNVFAAGHYNDVIDTSGKEAKIQSREVRLETRDLGPGSHMPM
jgi:methanesulfonate monooxygenase subunit beta